MTSNLEDEKTTINVAADNLSHSPEVLAASHDDFSNFEGKKVISIKIMSYIATLSSDDVFKPPLEDPNAAQDPNASLAELGPGGYFKPSSQVSSAAQPLSSSLTESGGEFELSLSPILKAGGQEGDLNVVSCEKRSFNIPIEEVVDLGSEDIFYYIHIADMIFPCRYRSTFGCHNWPPGLLFVAKSGPP